MTNEEDIFEAAAALPAAERPAYLDAACANQPEMRARIEALLRSHDASGFMAESAVPADNPEIREELARSQPEEAGQRIGNHKLLEQIGEGGFGVVWIAEQLEPVRRRVALKIIKPGMDSREVIGRFEQERQALAMMEHPNIAKVFDAGATDKGRPYFAMELVRGLKITDYCDRENLPTAERLKLLITVCQAVQHAHQKGIIHRDIKPSNILVTPGDDGEPVPKVIDFGVAKAIQQQSLTDATVYTRIEQMIGTPAYMSPEQAGLGPMDIDTRSDVYSLGVLLYELLTGRPPFDPKELLRAGLDEMRRVIREVEPPKPSTRISSLPDEELSGTAARRHVDPPNLISAIRGDLDWIAMKALEKIRARRYESATGLADEIQRHLTNQPVLARPPSRAYLLSRLIRRHKFGFAASAAIGVSLLGGITATTLGFVAAETAKKYAEDETTKTKLANEANEQNLHRASMADYANAASALDEDFKATRKGQRTVGSAKSRWHEAIVFLTRSLEREPTNRLAALLLYDTLRRRLVEKLDCPLVVFSSARRAQNSELSPDGNRVLTVSEDNTVRIKSTMTGEPLGEPMQHESYVLFARFSTDGTKVITASMDKAVRVWDAATGKVIGGPMRHDGQVNSADFNAEGTEVVSVSEDKAVRIWDVATGRALGVALRHDNVVLSAGFAPDSTKVLTISGDKTVRVWDAVTGQPFGEVMRHEGNVNSASFGLDSTMVVTVSDHTVVRIWELPSGRALGEPLRHVNRVTLASFSPDSAKLITATEDGISRAWEVTRCQNLGVPIRFEEGIMAASFSPDGTKVRLHSSSMTLMPDGSAVSLVFEYDLGRASISPVDAKIESGESDKLDWNAMAATNPGGSVFQEASVRSAHLSPDGTKGVTVIEDGTAQVWELLPNAESNAVINTISTVVLEWVRHVAGLRIDDDGQFQTIPESERLGGIATSELPSGPWADLAKWIRTPVPSRKIDPKSKFTLREIAERERDFGGEGNVQSLEAALRYDPSVPLARLFLAAASEKADARKAAKDRDGSVPQRAAFLRRYDLDALSREEGKMKNEELAALWVRAANHLLGLPPETKVGVGPKPTTTREEGANAARKALELVPGLPAAEEALKKLQP